MEKSDHEVTKVHSESDEVIWWVRSNNQQENSGKEGERRDNDDEVMRCTVLEEAGTGATYGVLGVIIQKLLHPHFHVLLTTPT